MKLGGPLKATVQVSPATPGGNGGLVAAQGANLSLSLLMRGPVGELYTAPLSYDAQGKASRPEAPKFKVIDNKGAEVAAGQFSYG